MTGHCHAPGCGAPSTRFGHYCTTHKARRRRHGHPAQIGITKRDLQGYLALVRERIRKNANSTVWATCEARWQALVGHAERHLQGYQQGQPGSRHALTAAGHVVKLGRDVPARTVVETVLAMYLMQDQQPRRFTSDDAFRAQLVRRVTRLTDANVGEWFNAATGRPQRAYREIAPGTATILAGWLAEALGLVGLQLAKLERDDAERQQHDHRSFHEAVAALA